jgi:hypothetical protein
VPRLYKFYPGICLTTEEKARKNLSQSTVYMLPKHPHITKPSQTHTLQPPPPPHTHTLQNNIKPPQYILKQNAHRTRGMRMYSVDVFELVTLCVNVSRQVDRICLTKNVMHVCSAVLGKIR